MDETPVIETLRLSLLPFGNEHMTERYVGWLNDPAVVRYSEQRHARHTLQSCKRHKERLLAEGHYFWAIELRNALSSHIGNITAYRDKPNNVVEMSILIGEPGHHGKRYGTEAWCAVVDHLINDAQVRRVEAGTMAANNAMLRVFEESGMREEGRRKNRFLLDGQPVDLVQACRLAVGDVEQRAH